MVDTSDFLTTTNGFIHDDTDVGDRTVMTSNKRHSLWGVVSIFL